MAKDPFEFSKYHFACLFPISSGICVGYNMTKLPPDSHIYDVFVLFEDLSMAFSLVLYNLVEREFPGFELPLTSDLMNVAFAYKGY